MILEAWCGGELCLRAVGSRLLMSNVFQGSNRPTSAAIGAAAMSAANAVYPVGGLTVLVRQTTGSIARDTAPVMLAASSMIDSTMGAVFESGFAPA